MQLFLKTVKTLDQVVTNSTMQQNDSALKVTVASSTTYIIDRAIFATASSTGDIAISMTAPSGSILILGYQSGANQGVITSGVTSSRIVIPSPNTSIPIHLEGVVILGGTGGDVQLKWAQATAVSGGTAVQAGSFLRADPI
jgi:hypothetical protein